MKKIYFIILVAVAIIGFSQLTNAANVIWLSAVSGNWNDGTKWSGGSAPGVNDTAVITVAGTYTVTLNASASIAKLNLGGVSGKQTLSSTSTILTIANASNINANGVYYMYQGTINGAGSMQNDGIIQMIYNNTLSVPVNNNDTIFVDYSANSMTGAFTTTTSSVLYFRCASSTGQLTFSNGWINNGKILMASTSCQYAYMIVSAGVLINSVGGTIQSSPLPNCVGYNRIDAAINNQGTMNIGYTLRVYTNAGASTNTGTVNFTSANCTLLYNNGTLNWTSGTLNLTTGCTFGLSNCTLNWNGGTTSGYGLFSFVSSSIANFNTASMPDQPMYFYQSTLASSQPLITNSKRIVLDYNNTITANLLNTDTIFVDYSANSMTGNLTTTSAAVLDFRCASSTGQLTFSNGWTNNGKIIMASVSCQYAYMIVTAGVLVNPVGSIIQSSPLPNCVGYNRIDAAINNQGTMNIGYTLRIYTNAGASTNTGTVNFTSANNTLTYYNGTLNWNSGSLNFASGCTFGFSTSTLNWNGGATSGTGLYSFNATSVGNFNTASMPDQPMYFYQSTLASSQPLITNSKRIVLDYNNTITANLLNTDTIFVDYSANSMTGALTTTSTSVLDFRCASSTGQLTFSNGWTNNGKIIMASVSCQYAYMIVTAGVLVNPVGSIIQSSPLPNCVGYNRIDAAINNQGTINIGYTLRVYTNAGASTNTGTVNFTSANNTLTYYNGTVNWNSGAVNFASGCTFGFSTATINWNGGTTTGSGLFSFNATSVGNFNTASMPDQPMYFYQSTLGSSLSLINNSRRIVLDYGNTVSANLQNNDTIYVDYSANNMTGTLTTVATSVLNFRCASSSGQLTFSNGWTNNGKIIMASISCQYPYLIVSAGTLVNAPGASITSSPLANCVGYNRIDAAINNQGDINVNYPLRHYTNVGPSSNTGNINFTSGITLTVYNGIFNWNGGIATGNGILAFQSATGNFNVATMPNIPTYFASSTLGSSFLPTSNSRRIELSGSNTISAALFNVDTLIIRSNPNTMTGALTTATSSVILFDGSESHSFFTVSSGFTNNGLIRFYNTANNYYYADLAVSTGVLINSSTGIIRSDPNPTSTYYNRLDAALDNQGTMLINFTLRHYTNLGASHNTGTINFTNGYNLEVYNGIWNWDGGTATSPTSQINFYSATARFNTATMPSIVTYFSSSKLESSLSGISNSKKIRISGSDSIKANLNNTDTIIIHSNPNYFTGAFTNTTTSKLLFDGLESHSFLTFSSGFTNNGLIRFYNTANNYYYADLAVNAGILTNASTGVIQCDPNPTVTYFHRLDAVLDNQGTMNINFTLRHYTNLGASHNTGTINFTNGYNLEIYNGIWNWDGGTASSPTSQINFYSATARFNTATMPSIVTYFSSSKLESSLSGISNSKKIRISGSDSIKANLNNTDTIIIHSNPNYFTGAFTNTTTSKLLFDGLESHSFLTFSSGFTNNGLIRFYNTANNYYYADLAVNAGILTNASTGVIQCDPNPTVTYFHRLDAVLDNQGTMNINFTLRHYTNLGASHNTGTINFSGGYNLEVFNGIWNWDGGTATSPTSQINFYTATARFNTATMPSIVTYFNASKLESSLSGISNSKKIRLSGSDSIKANLNNTDTIIVHSNPNYFTGTFTNNTTSKLLFDGLESSSYLTFSNGFTNNGLIRFYNTANNYYFGYLTVNAGVLTNASTGIIQSDPNPTYTYYHRLDGNVSNDGTVALNFQLYHGAGSFTNNSGGLIKGANYLNNLGNLLTNNGTISPGASPGILQINAKIKNGTSSIWNIEVGGLTAGTQYDRIDNNFTSTTDSVNGTLNISLINSFIPGLGDSVVIETHNLRVGTFATITGQAIPGGLFWNVFYRPNSIVLRAGNPPNLDIVSTAGAHGTISPLGTTSVVYNGTQTYNFTPALNYVVDSIYVDGVYAGNASSYTFNNVTVNHTIHVTFKQITWIITSTSGSGGTVSPSGSVVVVQGNNQVFNITANPCYLIDSVIVDGNYTGTGAIYTFTNVNAAHTIRAVFRTGPSIAVSGPLTFCDGGSVVLNAGSGYTAYNWSNGATTQSTTITTSGTYTCIITSTGGCTSSESKTVTVNPLPVVTFSQPYPGDNGHTCVTDGGINLSTSGLGLPAGGSYSGAGVYCYFQCVFTPSTAGVGTHTLSYFYTDGNGCSNSATNSVTVDQSATADAGPASMVLCNTLTANLNGSVGGSATGGSWSTSGNGTFNNASALNAIYTLSSADSLAGTVTLTLTSNNPTGPCGAVSDQIVLYYNPDAIAYAGPEQQCVSGIVTVIGGITGYPANPHWTSTGSGTFANPNLMSTTYTFSHADSVAGIVNLILTPIDPNGNCTFTPDTLHAFLDPSYTVNAGSDVVLCGNGNIIANLNGSFTNASSVTWTSNGTGSFSNVNDPNATYTLSPVDQAGGVVTLTLTSNDPVGPCVAIYDQMLVKYKYGSTSLADSVCGDTVNYLSPIIIANTYTLSTIGYSWTTTGSGNFSNQSSLYTYYTGSNADIASGSVKLYFQPIDLSGECSLANAKDSIRIFFNPHYSINILADTLKKCADSIFNVSATSTSPSVTWSTGGSGTFGNANLLSTTYAPSSADTAAGTVKLYITTNDPVGPCSTVADSVVLIMHHLPDATAGTNSPVCAGSELDITGSGGVVYFWTGPNGYTSTQQNIVRSNATINMSGPYILTIANTFGCVDTAITIATVQNCGCTPPVLSESHTNVSCFSGSNGSATVTIVSGTGDYAYQWSSGQTTATITGLTEGTYICTVSAGIGCTDVIVIGITQPSPMNAVALVTNVACKYGASGSINLTPLGGTPGYTYHWNNGNTNEDRTSLTAGNYSVIITDANGCTLVKNYTVDQPALILSCSVHKTNIRCGGKNSGSTDAIASGGTLPYSYLWSDGQTTVAISNLYIGTYTCTVTDANGCVATKSLVITQNPTLVVFATATNTTTYGGSDGTATAFVSGGIAPYSYLWSSTPSQSTSTATGLHAGFYKVKVSDSKGCLQIASVAVNQPNPKLAASNNLLNVYPNPANNKLHVDINFSGSSVFTIELITIEGKIVKAIDKNSASGILSESIDLTGIPSGFYSLKVISNQNCEIRRIVIER